MKWILRLFAFVLLVVVIAGVSILFLPADRIARIAADQLRNLTGREVTISGDVSLTVWPVLGASVGGLEVGNADWSEAGPMLTAQNAAVGVDAAALLRGEIRITRIAATSPTIRLESKADGRASWVFTDASGRAQIETETAPTRQPKPFSIAQLEITDATLVYDAEGADLVSYSGVDLLLDWPDRLGAADIDATVRPAGTPVRVDARVDRFAGFLEGQVQPVRLTLDAGGGTAMLDGRASLAGEVAGALTLDLPETDAFLRALALPAPDLPRGLGRSIKGRADLTLTADRNLSLRDLTAELGGNRLSGAADVALNGTPQVNAQLDAGRLDLAGLTGGIDSGNGGGGGGSGASDGWSRSAIDASGLAAFNGEIALRAEAVALAGFNLGTTRVLLRNDNSRMVTELREVQAYDGLITGDFVVNNRSGLSVGGKLAVRDVALQPLLRDAAGLTRLTGAVDADLDFLGAGGSVAAIMQSLSGNGIVRVGRGTIEGIDLDRLMRRGDASGGTTIFDSLGAGFAIDGGVLRNDDLLMQLRNFEARGAGQVDLGGRTLDYLFTPVALKVNDGKGLAFPIRIKGPWANPRILPDLSAAVDLNLSAEKKKLESRARETVDRKLREELGVKADDARSLEDAAKDKLGEEVKKGLRKLFD